MPRISKTTEQKLLAAVEKTAEYVNAGEEPNVAIAKAAQALSVPRGHLAQIVYAYNTGRTNWQRQHGVDVFEKAAEFPLADLKKVEAILYPATVKTAAEQRFSTCVSPEYSRPPEFLQKQAEAERLSEPLDWTIAGKKAPAPYRKDMSAEVRRQHAEVEKLQKAAEEARRQASTAFDKLAAAFDALDTYFRRTSAVPVTQVQSVVSQWFGPTATAIMDGLVKLRPELTKFAATRKAQVPDCTREPYTLVNGVVEALEGYRAAKQRWEKAAAAAERAKEALQRPFCYVDVTASVLGPVDPPETQQAEGRGNTGVIVKQANPLLGQVLSPVLRRAIEEQLGENRLNAPASKTVSDLAEALADPVHEHALQKIKLQAAIQDMILNDPIIANYDPDEIIDSINDLADIAPDAIRNRLLLRTLLRKRLEQGSLDTFEINEAIKAQAYEDEKARNAAAHRQDIAKLQAQRQQAAAEQAHWAATRAQKAQELKAQAAQAKADQKTQKANLKQRQTEFEFARSQQPGINRQQAAATGKALHDVISLRNQERREQARFQEWANKHNVPIPPYDQLP